MTAYRYIGTDAWNRFGRRGQAAALDLAVFTAICAIALAYLTLQSARAGAASLYLDESENLNELAIRTLDALAEGGVDFEVKTLQPAALSQVKSCISDDVRKILTYADMAIAALDTMERAALGQNGAANPDDPFVNYIDSRMGDILKYLDDSSSLLDSVIAPWLGQAESAKGVPCDALSSIAQYLPGYGEMDASCSGSASGLLDGLSGSISSAEDAVSGLKNGLISGLEALTSLSGEELAGKIRSLRCTLMAVKDAANAVLTYVETGVNMDVSFLELWPVKAGTKTMSLYRLLGDSMIAGDNFAFGDDVRSVMGGAGLFMIRNKDIDGKLPEVSITSGPKSSSFSNVTESVWLYPKSPLAGVTNTTAEGDYYGMRFGAEGYKTQAGSLAIRLKFLGGELGGEKQKTEYFEGIDYISGSPAYPSSEHYRTYNGSFVKGRVTEGRISKTANSSTGLETIGTDLLCSTSISEVSLLRPMLAEVFLAYENTTFPEAAYSFDILHKRATKNYNCSMNNSDDCPEHNDTDALKSMVLGAILAGRNNLKGGLAKAVEERLDGLLEGYQYTFEVRDCCSAAIAIHEDAEPPGRRGEAKYYFMGDGSRAEMRLTVWR